VRIAFFLLLGPESLRPFVGGALLRSVVFRLCWRLGRGRRRFRDSCCRGDHLFLLQKFCGRVKGACPAADNKRPKCASWRKTPLVISQHRSRGAAAHFGQGTDNVWTAVSSAISMFRPFAFRNLQFYSRGCRNAQAIFFWVPAHLHNLPASQ